MTRVKNFILATVSLYLTATATLAQSAGDTVVSSGFTTFGYSIEGAYQIDPQFRLRGVFMAMPDLDEFSGTFENGGTTFDYDASIGGIAALVDYYPTGAGWRLSGGMMISRFTLDGTAALTAGNSFTLDDGTVIDTGTASLDSSFARRVAPIFTAGYDYWFDDNWVMSGEAGAVFPGGLVIDASSTNATLQAEIEDDADVQQARDDAMEVTVYPYISFSIGYRF